jgi:hypothetical protein
MSMKSTSSPRRVYSRNDVTHTLFAGDVFGTKGETKISLDFPVKIVGNGDGTITVSQRRNHQKAVSEVWSKVNVPCHARA